MIRINLLPVREIKKKEAVKRAIVTYVVGVVIVVVAMGALWWMAESTLGSLEKKKKDLTQKEATLRKQVAVVETLKEEEADLKEKLDTISNLEASRRGPARILEELSKRLPPEKAFLTELNQNGSKLSLSGYAIDNETIALFMANLDPKADDVVVGLDKSADGGTDNQDVKKSAGGNNIFSNVELVSTQQEIKNDVTLKKFSLNLSVNLAEPKAAADADKKG